MLKNEKIYFSFRMIIGVVLAVSAIAKIYDIVDFGRIIHSYNLIPDNLVVPVTYLIPYFELAVGLMILLNMQPKWAYAAGIIMLGVFTTVSFIRYMNGDVSDCGCFGNLLKRQNDWTLFIENGIMIFTLIFLYIFHSIKIKRYGIPK